MKKYILSLLLVSLTFVAEKTFAQIGQGLFVGGSLGYTTSSTKNTTTSRTGTSSTITEEDGPKNSAFHLMPRVGYFFTDNIAAGITFGYGTYTEINTSYQYVPTNVVTKTTVKGNTLEIGLFGRYAQQLGDGDFYVYGDLGFGIGSGKSKVRTETKTNISTTLTEREGPKISRTSLGISPGILFFPTKKIGLEASLGNILGYISTKETTETSSGSNTTTVVEKTNEVHLLNVSSFSFIFGFNYYLSR